MTKMKAKRIIGLILAIMMLATIFVGCKGKDADTEID